MKKPKYIIDSHYGTFEALKDRLATAKQNPPSPMDSPALIGIKLIELADINVHLITLILHAKPESAPKVET